MKLLLVEDEPRIQQLVQTGLAGDQVDVEIFTSAEQAFSALSDPHLVADLFLVDAVLPGAGGLEFCRWLRQLGRVEPIVLLTAGATAATRAAGLHAGANDVVANPPDLEFLRSRLALWFPKGTAHTTAPLSVGDLSLDPRRHVFLKAGTELSLSRKEFQLLEFLIQNAQHIVTRAMIASAVWNNDTNQYTNVIDVFINHLRKKLDAAGGQKLLQTVRGKGFRLAAEASQT